MASGNNQDCPSDNCTAGRWRQSEIGQDYWEQIPKPERNLIELVDQTSPTRSTAMRCGYCGCVYLKFPTQIKIVGWLDSGIRGPGWHRAKTV